MAPLLSGLIIVTGLSFLLLAFSDRDGYDGDDLSTVSAVFQLDAAKRGDLALYRYAWQPLAYELSAWVYRRFDTSDAVFMSAPIACAIALAVLLYAMATAARNLKSPWLHLAILILFPELFYTGLYYNTTALAMPAAAVAVLFLTGPPGRGRPWRPALIGVMLTLASFFRFDFVLIFPFVVASLWIESRSLRPMGSLVVGRWPSSLLAARWECSARWN